MLKILRTVGLILVVPLLLIHGIWLLISVSKPTSSKIPAIVSTPTVLTSEPKPIVVLVPGFAAGTILSPVKDKDWGYRCSDEPIPVAKGDSNTYFGRLPQWLIEDGDFDVRIAALENNQESTPSIYINSECLRRQILKTADLSPTKDIVLIAHSMGGLVARAYIQSDIFRQDSEKRAKPPVRTVFLVAVPNQSMPYHFWLKLFLKCDAPDTNQKAACEFSSSSWVAEFNRTHKDIPPGVDFYAIGGTLHNGGLGFLSGCYICAVSGSNDGVIPAKSSIGFEGARGRAVYPETHLPSVGEPSYFSVYKGKKSQAYTSCIAPVLVMGDPDGCKGTTPLTCRSPRVFIILLLEALILLAILIWGLRQRRRNRL